MLLAVFDLVTELLNDAKAVMLLALGVVIVALAIGAFVKTRSVPAVMGVVAGGLLAFALLTQFDVLADSTGDEIRDRAGVTNTDEFGTE